MAFRYEIRLSGEGGQGLDLAGKILAEEAAIYDERNATQSQSYGPEARGGASKSEVVISDAPIDYPKATRIDAMLALTQEAYDALTAAGLATVGDLLEAADDDGTGEKAGQLVASGLGEDECQAAVDAARDFETAPAAAGRGLFRHRRAAAEREHRQRPRAARLRAHHGRQRRETPSRPQSIAEGVECAHGRFRNRKDLAQALRRSP